MDPEKQGSKFGDKHLDKLPRPFAEGITARTLPDSRCLCTWAWAPSIGKPWALKYRAAICPMRHSPMLPEPTLGDYLSALDGFPRISYRNPRTPPE